MEKKLDKIIANIDMAVAKIRSLEVMEDFSPMKSEKLMGIIYYLKKARKDLKNLEVYEYDSNAG